MAITVTYLGPLPGLPPELGLEGCEMVRLTGDGADTSELVTLPLTSGIKTIRRAFGAISHNIPAAGVAAATGFTATPQAVIPNGAFVDIIVQGDPR
jgi:hypothetical protein